MLPVANAIAVKRRRVQGKRPPPEWYAALEVERFGEAGLAMLCQDARRFQVHYTHVRTRSPGHKQPDQLTRKQLWEHLVTVYREAYPCADSPTSSVLQFGLVTASWNRPPSPENLNPPEVKYGPTRFQTEKPRALTPPIGVKHESTYLP